ncbi:pentatricopeptide repeat domain-containing protein 3, mitochondrial [Oncorhynchus tshawytscha]|uniref:pentatricopeptide repeat domain-containing protein 3, mitochondrial n=1 Tax=Oncorhynchus tshawytscha TaxID=74940 RepID=UPI000D09D077|nr:pentatricopeptide repeat domain-containing protein 3, mitochondrial [Oncorhynchus tshawytscha]
MAAPGKYVGHYIYKNGRFLLSNFEQFCFRRNFGWSVVVCQQNASTERESAEAIVIPKKKTWSKWAVLQALASTVNRDPTAPHYMFQDDPYLTPRTSAEFKLYSLSQESGRMAANHIVNKNPKFFQKDFAEPHIPCLMPETMELCIEEVSEAALLERIMLRKVKAAVDMYDQLLQTGTTVSPDASNDLLDLICLYGDRDPVQDDKPEAEDVAQEVQEEGRRRKGRLRRASDLVRIVWRENNNAERIFNLLPERDTRAYSALIRGMVKYGAHVKAFNTYTDMLNNRLTADVHTFNALISAAPEVRERYTEKWDLIVDLLNQMNEQKVKPNLLTFNALLKALRRCGSLARAQSLHTLSEMKAMGIAPSLASFDHVLGIFYKAASPSQGQTDILQEVMTEVAGRTFVAQDPDDVNFFSSAMRICLDTKDIEAAYKVHDLLSVGENWRMLGDSFQQSIYYGRMFNLLCMMEHIDVVLKWYKELIPSLYYPNPQGMRDLLQALDTDNRLDMIPQIWKDIRRMGHDNKSDLVDELLSLMARDKHSPEIQESFAVCALDVKSLYEQGQGARMALEWTATAMTNITSVLLAAQKKQQAWDMLKLFKTKNRVPSEELMEEFLASIKSSNDPQHAMELVQISASFCLPSTPKLAERVLQAFELSEEQKTILSELEVSTEVSE